MWPLGFIPCLTGKLTHALGQLVSSKRLHFPLTSLPWAASTHSVTRVTPPAAPRGPRPKESLSHARTDRRVRGWLNPRLLMQKGGELWGGNPHPKQSGHGTDGFGYRDTSSDWGHLLPGSGQ